MRELDLFRYERKGDDLVVSEVADEEGWRDVKETLMKSVGMGSVPVIRVDDADYGGNRTLSSCTSTTAATCSSSTPSDARLRPPLCGAARSCSRPCMDGKQATPHLQRPGFAAKAGSRRRLRARCRLSTGLHGAWRYNPPPMPIYEYRCRHVAGRSPCSRCASARRVDPVCEHCGSRDLTA